MNVRRCEWGPGITAPHMATQMKNVCICGTYTRILQAVNTL
jgi:aerobic-type carbon monoxide dehydrogenase small subunit (CoxS/CutS family)